MSLKKNRVASLMLSWQDYFKI